MKRWAIALLVLAIAAPVSMAEDKGNPTGTWTWSAGGGGGGQARTATLKLKLDGDKLTGGMVGRNDQETPIENASFKDGVVSFSITRERQGMKTTTKYEGKLDGDTIKGKTTSERNGQPTSRDWEAKRKKDA